MSKLSPINIAARSITAIDDNVYEVTRYGHRGLRYFSWLLLLITLGSFAYGWHTQNDYWEEIKFTWNPEPQLREQYDNFWAHFDDMRSFEEYYEGMSEMHNPWYALPRIFTLLPVLALGIILFFPRATPLRIDRKRRIAYTWFLGCFYITDNINRNNGDYKFKLWQDFSYLGGTRLRIGLSRLGKPEKVHDSYYGTFPKCRGEDQTPCVHAFIGEICDTPAETELPTLEKGPFLFTDIFRALFNFTLIPSGKFNEQRTEENIQRFLENKKQKRLSESRFSKLAK